MTRMVVIGTGVSYLSVSSSASGIKPGLFLTASSDSE
jgi:hypothetical protein